MANWNLIVDVVLRMLFLALVFLWFLPRMNCFAKRMARNWKEVANERIQLDRELLAEQRETNELLKEIVVKLRSDQQPKTEEPK